MKSGESKEAMPPLSNLSPGGSAAGKCRFLVRSLLDLQVASVRLHLEPWLEQRTGTLLEVGCGAQPYRHLVPSGCRYTGLDSERAQEDFRYSLPDTIYYRGDRFPFQCGCFDSLFHTEVLEHVYHGSRFLAECRRVLKPGGAMLFTVPFQARYHYIPHDFFRYTPAALHRMLGEAGFTGIEIRPRGSDITVAAYKCISILYRWMRSGASGKLAGMLLSPLAAPILLIGAVSLRWALGSPDDCLGYTVTANAAETLPAKNLPGGPDPR